MVGVLLSTSHRSVLRSRGVENGLSFLTLKNSSGKPPILADFDRSVGVSNGVRLDDEQRSQKLPVCVEVEDLWNINCQAGEECMMPLPGTQSFETLAETY